MNGEQFHQYQLNSDGEQFHHYQLNSDGEQFHHYQLNSDGEQFHQYQQNEQPPLTSNNLTQKYHVIWMLEMQVIT